MCATPIGMMRFSFFLKTFFFPVFAGAALAMLPQIEIKGGTGSRQSPSSVLQTGLGAPFQGTLRLGGGLLLISDRAPARTLSSPCIRMRTLASHRQIAPMPQPAIGADLDQPPDVQRQLFPQVTFDAAIFLDHLADLRGLVLAQIFDLLVRIHSRARQNCHRARPPDAINVSQADFDALQAR